MKNIEEEIKYEQNWIRKLIADIKTLDKPEDILSKAQELHFSYERLQSYEYLTKQELS